MKRTIFLLSFILFLTTFTTETKAQFLGTFSIQAVVGLPDTVSTNSTYSFGFIVENVGNTIYSGTLNFDFLVDSNGGGNINSFGVGQVGGFAPGDTATVPVNNYAFSITNNTFNIGDNVVVVWPRAINPNSAADSLTFHVYVTNLSSIEGSGKMADLKIFPNPAKDYVSFTSEKNKIDEVSIYDMTGRLVLKSKTNLRIFTGHLYRGVYISEIKFSDGEIISRKIVAGNISE